MLKAFIRLADRLVTIAHFRPEVTRKLRSTREEEIRRMKRVDQDEKAEERKVAAEKIKKEERDRLLRNMSAEEQKKFLAKEKEREQKREMKRQTRKGWNIYNITATVLIASTRKYVSSSAEHMMLDKIYRHVNAQGLWPVQERLLR